MDIKELAAQLNGCEYRSEVSRELEVNTKADGIVIVFGASDDLMEFRGAIHDETGAWAGATVRVDGEGLVPDWENIDHDD